MSKLNENFIYEILSVVEEIPEGRVASYGQIAKLIGRDKNSRLVGKVLSRAEWYGEYPCHRVVNSWLVGAEASSGRRGCTIQEKWLCGYEKLPVEMWNRVKPD